MARRAGPVSGLVLGVVCAGLLLPARAQGAAPVCGETALANAITAANTSADADTIELGCSFEVTAASTAQSLLPKITSPITISGGSNQIGSINASLTRGAEAPFDRAMLWVDGAGSLTLGNVVIDGGSLSTAWGNLTNFGTTSLSNVRFVHNAKAILNQGVMTVAGSSLTDNNQAGSCGSAPAIAQHNNSAQLTVSGTYFGDNSACSSGAAGAVEIGSGTTATISSSTFEGNEVGGNGGAITNSGSLAVTGVTFTGNRAATPSGGGGAISSTGALTVTDSTFTANTTGAAGGAIRSLGGSLTVTRSTFDANTADTGGGLALVNTTTTVENSTLHANVARRQSAVGRGGGIYVSGGTATLRHVTLAANQALDFGQGGAIFNDNGAVTAIGVLLKSAAGGTCGVGNSFPLDPNDLLIDGGGNVTDGAYFCPSTFANRGFSFGPLGSYGGSTRTVPLASAQAAIDVVPAGQCLPTDQRGVPRPQHEGCDAGAWEDRPPPAPQAPDRTSGPAVGRGELELSWPGVSDPDGTATTYLVQHRDADDGSFTTAAALPGTTHAFTAQAPEAEGTWTYRVIASDGSIGIPGPASATVVVDRTPPPVPIPYPNRTAEATDPDGVDWWVDEVTVGFAAGADPALPDGSPGSGTTITSGSVQLTSSGTVFGTSIDAVGNESAQAAMTVHVDATEPTISFTDCPTTVTQGKQVAAHWTAEDAGSGLTGAATGAVALDTATVGSHEVATPPTTDLVGHHAAGETCAYEVVAPPAATGTELRVRHLGGRDYRAVITVLPTAATGKVTLREGDRVLARGWTGAGSARVVLDFELPRGTHRLRARYLGSTSFSPSVSLVVSVRR